MLYKTISNIAMSVALAVSLALFFTPGVHAQPEPAPAPAPESKEPVKVELITNLGAITLELYPDKAPITVANFLQYVDEGHYNGTIFHRVISSFMIQGGGFTPGLQQKRTRSAIKNEWGNGLKNERGTIAMARTGDPDSATAQFFINVVDNFRLDEPISGGAGYCVFGKVVEGLNVVDRIKAVPTGSSGGMQNVPLEAVVIEEVKRAAE